MKRTFQNKEPHWLTRMLIESSLLYLVNNINAIAIGIGTFLKNTLWSKIILIAISLSFLSDYVPEIFAAAYCILSVFFILLLILPEKQQKKVNDLFRWMDV